jgi:transcriptional regulator with XRE-family HTH domain
MTTDELEAERRRRGYWLRRARLRANLNQADVAETLGLSKNSGSTIFAWEKGRRDPDASQMTVLARLYGVPVSVFSDPRETDDEWLDGLARDAIGLATEDEDEAVEPDPDADEGRDGQRRRRSA